MNTQEKIMISAAQLYDRTSSLEYITGQNAEELQHIITAACRGSVNLHELKETKRNIFNAMNCLEDIGNIIEGIEQEARIEINIQLHLK